jgi:phosphatidylinositol 4-kinase
VPHIQQLLKYLTDYYDDIPYLQLYVTKILNRLRSEQLLFYLPQIYQTLTLKSGKVIMKFLLEYAERSTLFAHQLVWISKVEAKQEVDPHNKTPRTPEIEAHLQRLSARSL